MKKPKTVLQVTKENSDRSAHALVGNGCDMKMLPIACDSLSSYTKVEVGYNSCVTN